MWDYLVEISQSQSTYKIKLFWCQQQLTYSQVIEYWQDDRDFRIFFTSILSSVDFSAYFWETPPITLSTINKKFEFVLVKSPQLARVKSNPNPFQEYFRHTSSNQKIITFPNLQQDALLVVPCPIAEKEIYCHLASFVRKAPEIQNHLLWQTLSQAITQKLDENKPIWVSTSGLGVYWLHIRLDSFPKYYNFQPYKYLN